MGTIKIPWSAEMSNEECWAEAGEKEEFSENDKKKEKQTFVEHAVDRRELENNRKDS